MGGDARDTALLLYRAPTLHRRDFQPTTRRPPSRFGPSPVPVSTAAARRRSRTTRTRRRPNPRAFSAPIRPPVSSPPAAASARPSSRAWGAAPPQPPRRRRRRRARFARGRRRRSQRRRAATRSTRRTASASASGNRRPLASVARFLSPSSCLRYRARGRPRTRARPPRARGSDANAGGASRRYWLRDFVFVVFIIRVAVGDQDVGVREHRDRAFEEPRRAESPLQRLYGLEVARRDPTGRVEHQQKHVHAARRIDVARGDAHASIARNKCSGARASSPSRSPGVSTTHHRSEAEDTTAPPRPGGEARRARARGGDPGRAPARAERGARMASDTGRFQYLTSQPPRRRRAPRIEASCRPRATMPSPSDSTTRRTETP